MQLAEQKHYLGRLPAPERTKQHVAATAFVAFLEGPVARPIFKKYGFLLPEEFSDAT